MEDLVVGLAKSVVEGALTKVQSAIQEDEKLRQRAQSNLAFMTVEFEMMQSFLDVANKENVKNKLVATWVSHVRKVAYDVQDCIDLVMHMDETQSWWRRLLPSCSGEPPPLDQAVAEIEQLKARVEDVSKCYTRYNLINDSGSKLIMMQQPGSRTTAANMLVEARQATKRQQGFGDLTQLISKSDKDLQIISVWGAGGDHGTTSIIRKAYNDTEIRRDFTCRAWVKLTTPFNSDKFIRCFMTQIYENSCKDHGESVGVEVQRKMKATKDDLPDEFVKQVNNERYLVVLENLSNMVDWDTIRTFLPDKKKSSRIIISTHRPEVASLCVGHSYHLLELKMFSAEHSVCVFFEKGSQGHGNKGKDKIISTEISIPSQGSSGDLSSSDKLKAATDISLVERRFELNELRKYIATVRINSSQVASVWGMPGVGKSAIVRNLYADKMLNSDQFFEYGWVDVSHPFILRDFSASLLLSFHSVSLGIKDAHRVTMQTKDPIQECHMFLSDRPCLVVINNLQSTEEWDLIEASLVSRPSKSVVIVLTTEANIALHCAHSKDDVLNVKGLEADAAFSLFKNKVQKSNSLLLKRGGSELENLFHVFKGNLQELILRCGGLPIVIAAIADSLAEEINENRWKQIIGSMTDGFMKELQKPQFESLRDLFRWMNSYVGNCPDILKPCILYMAIFPPEHSIRRRRLVRRWVSEGYSKENNNRSLEEYGEDLFSMLVNMSIIQQPAQSVTTTTNDTRMVNCQVNRFLYEYIISQRKEENLVFQLGEGRSISTQCTWHHLTIWKQWNRDQIVFERINLSRLRSLTVFGEWKSFFISKTMKLLRVLDLENASGLKDEDLDQMMLLLRRLKYLSLRGCHEISNLPSSIGGLRQLQSLDIRHTSIVTLPAKITKLQKLQYVRAGTIVQAEEPSTPCLPASWLPRTHKSRRLIGVTVPRGVGKLTALHTFGVINVGASRGKGIMKQLEKLTQLHKLGVSGITRNNSQKFFSAIFGHGNLESLSVRLKKGHTSCLDGISLPWEKLQSLKLYGLADKLPLSTGRLPEVELPPRPRLPEDELPVTRLPLPEDDLPVPGPCLREDELPVTIPPLTEDELPVPGPRLPEDELPVTRPPLPEDELPVPGPRLPEDELPVTGTRLPEDELPVPGPRLPEDELPVTGTSLPQDRKPLSRPRLPQHELSLPRPRLPRVVSDQVSKLTKLVLEMDNLTQDDMKFVAELPNLCFLRLRVNQSRLVFLTMMSGLELSTYTKVKILEIACSSRLHVTFGSQTMKNLELLKLDFSSGLVSYKLSGLDFLSQLKEVLLKGSNDQTLKTDLQTQLANHPTEPVVNMEESEQPGSS